MMKGYMLYKSNDEFVCEWDWLFNWPRRVRWTTWRDADDVVGVLISHHVIHPACYAILSTALAEKLGEKWIASLLFSCRFAMV